MTDAPTSTTRVERLVSIAAGGGMLLMALVGFAWAARWTVTWARLPAGFPADMVQVLLGIGLISVALAVGGWRILRLGFSGPFLGLTLGRVVLVLSLLAAAAAWPARSPPDRAGRRPASAFSARATSNFVSSRRFAA
jgi:hypothetical protein